MIQIQSFIYQSLATFITLFTQPNWHDYVDIILLTILIYYVVKMAMNTRANSLFKGILVVLGLAWLADMFEITTVRWLLQQLLGMGVLALVIVFQPEMRRALDQLGRSKWVRRISGRGWRRTATQTQKNVSEIVKATMEMSEKHIGALILFERGTVLTDLAESGTVLDSEISAALIRNIFEPNTPLHDGAVLISNERIYAAACFLDLDVDKNVSRELGTRHRAGLGITEVTDAVSLIVSEETGTISVAEGGKLERYLDSAKLTRVLTNVFAPQDNASEMKQAVRGLRGKGRRNEE